MSSESAILVGHVGDIADEGVRLVPRAETGHDDDIAVFYSGGAYYAIDDTCTHQRASLAEGWVEGGEVECPLHSARFSLRTGAALCLPATVGVRTHAVHVRGDEIWLSVAGDATTATGDAAGDVDAGDVGDV